MNKYDLLCVYNTCGISHSEPYEVYISNIRTILDQTNINCRILLSSCLNHPDIRKAIQEEYDDNIDYVFIDEIVPINVSFNRAVLEAVKNYGKFKAYVYIDSGARFNHPDSLKKLYDLHKSGSYAITYAGSDTDNGYCKLKINWQSYPHIRYNHLPNDPYVLEIGEAVHPHVQILDNDLLNYYGRLWPDIFAMFGTESCFSFLASAIKKQCIASESISINHKVSVDGASSGFMQEHDKMLRKQKDNKQLWDFSYKTTRNIREIIFDPVGIASGFGHEEFQNVLIHNNDQFDDNKFCKNDNLKKWLKENLFLKKNELNYDNIKCLSIFKDKITMIEKAEKSDKILFISKQIDLKDGRRIWVPPDGKPFWIYPHHQIELTDEEVKEYITE